MLFKGASRSFFKGERQSYPLVVPATCSVPLVMMASWEVCTKRIIYTPNLDLLIYCSFCRFLKLLHMLCPLKLKSIDQGILLFALMGYVERKFALSLLPYTPCFVIYKELLSI